VVGTGLLALGGFTLSFAALRDLAVRVGMPADLAWLWPLLIDGMIVEATLAVVALAQRGSRRAVWYAWFLLAVGALVSVGSNGAHAVISGHGWAGAAAASVPPVVLLATTHLTVLLMAAPESPAAPAQVPAAVVAPELQPEPAPDGGGTSAPVDGHAIDAPAVEPAVTDAPAALLPPAAPDVEPAPAPTVEDAAQPPATAEHAPADDEPAVTEEGLGQWVAQQEESGVTVTGSMVADVLGVSASTGRRRLAALRKASQPRLRLAGSE
jgi:putative phage excisionase